MIEAAPLKTTFLLTSMIGFLISAFYISRYSVPYSVAFSAVFVLMFIAAMISMRRATPDEQLFPRPEKIQ